MADDILDTVSEDWVRYAEAATKGQYNFLVDDPDWAEDFAPEGLSLH